MKYFLKKTKPSKKGEYLQIYISQYIPGKGSRNRSYKSLGYVSDLMKQGIKDPIAYGQRTVGKLNESISTDVPQIGDVSTSMFAGHFLLKARIDRLSVDDTLNLMASNRKTSFKISDFIRSMIYAQVLNPGSKLSAFENVIPNIYGARTFSYDQILDEIEYIGSDYQKYIECFNHGIELNWHRNTKKAFFDCTNYYFEIDLEDDLRRKGPSKENRKSPIIGQALMLDAEQVPIAMERYPGNESEKPYLRKTVEDRKSRYDISSKIIEVADKGLNCAKNIYYLHKEGKDGYIFSKSFKGKGLSQAEKEWIALDNDDQLWKEVKDEEGNLLYRYKETIGSYEYKFIDDDGREVRFRTKEKRVVTYNPYLARKQIREIEKEVEKARNLSVKGFVKEEIGDKAKYINIKAKDNSQTKFEVEVNEETVSEAKKYAGYNLLVTSEWKMTAKEIYKAYHGLWRIEESFRVRKTYLEARPVFLRNKESIYGHFLICYLALTVLRLLELKTFEDKIPISALVDFIRQYTITETKEKTYINNSTRSSVYEQIKSTLGILKLGNLYLTQKDVNSLFDIDV